MNKGQIIKELKNIRATGELLIETASRLENEIGGTGFHPSQKSGLDEKQVAQLKVNRRKRMKK